MTTRLRFSLKFLLTVAAMLCAYLGGRYAREGEVQRLHRELAEVDQLRAKLKLSEMRVAAAQQQVTLARNAGLASERERRWLLNQVNALKVYQRLVETQAGAEQGADPTD